jgi:UDP-N-acetylmuramate--alanine ligase
VTTPTPAQHHDPSQQALADHSLSSGAPHFVGMHAFFIGIGGSGMSGLAQVFLARGARVSGSDRDESDMLAELRGKGISITLDQTSGWLPEGVTLVVASAAIRPDHPQWMAAEQRGLRVMLYAEALGACMRGHTGIAVAGTHGKSSTTAMLGCALTDAGLDPSVIVGATSPQLAEGCIAGTHPTSDGLGSLLLRDSVGFRVGQAQVPTGTLHGQPGLLVVEACEYNRSFHNFRPRFASIANVESDHLDCYGTFDNVIASFHEFARSLPSASEGGRLLIGHDGAQRTRVTAGLACEVFTIGFSPEADYVVSFDPTTRACSLAHHRTTLARWTARIPGSHMALNAGTAMTLALWAGADPLKVARSLSLFAGVDRRMQLLGEVSLTRAGRTGSVRVFDDYGHHPTEVDVTLRALREAERPEQRGGRLICVFQPHQHSRTRHMLSEFASSFQHADIVLVPHIYFVRDSQEERTLVTAGDLVEKLVERGVDATHLDSFDAIVERLEQIVRPGDLVVVMGAGPVWQVARGFLALHASTSKEKLLAPAST